MDVTNNSGLVVGDNITVPEFVDPSGKIPVRSAEVAEVARWFGLNLGVGRHSRRRGSTRLTDVKRLAAAVHHNDAELPLAPGTITLISGPSGAGKSCLLQRLRMQRPDHHRWIDLMSIRVANVPVVNCFGDLPLMETLKLLGRVGLGEAWSYLRTPAELSQGQKFRLRLAIGLWRALGSGGVGGGRFATPQAAEKGRGADWSAKPQAIGRRARPIIVCDEFAAVLDRLTASIVARCLRRAIDAEPHVAAIVATSHDDLVAALSPDMIVRCDFGKTTWETRNAERGMQNEEGEMRP